MINSVLLFAVDQQAIAFQNASLQTQQLMLQELRELREQQSAPSEELASLRSLLHAGWLQ